MFKYKGKTALVTGASEGIGAEFVRALAARGCDVILVARRLEKMQEISREVQEKFNVKTHILAIDLSTTEGIKETIAQVKAIDLIVDILVNNAGFGTYGHFENMDPEREHQLVMLNVAALLDLTHAFVPYMLEKKDGAIINVASIGGLAPVPYMATYGASKAFVVSLSEALWYEYKDRGVRVLSLNPGNTDTAFHSVSGDPGFALSETVQTVVKNGLKALESGQCSVVSGAGNWLVSGMLPRVLPRNVVATVAGFAMKPRKTK